MPKKKDILNKVILSLIISSTVAFSLFPFVRIEWIPNLNDRIIFSIISLLNVISILRYIQGSYGTITLNEETPSASFTISAVIFLSVYYLKIFTEISMWILLPFYLISGYLLLNAHRRMNKSGRNTARKIKISKK